MRLRIKGEVSFLISLVERDKSARERETTSLKGTNPRAKGKPRR